MRINGIINLWVDGDGFTRPFKLASHTLFAKWFPIDVIATTSSDLKQHSQLLTVTIQQGNVPSNFLEPAQEEDGISRTKYY